MEIWVKLDLGKRRVSLKQKLRELRAKLEEASRKAGLRRGSMQFRRDFLRF
jgi:hypothetical protein